MQQPWEPEREVSIELARALVAAQFPELAGAAAEPFGTGWDNTAYLFDRTWVFRFPRRTIAVELIRNESALLPSLAKRLPLAVPDPVFVGEPSDAFPWPFAGYRSISGHTACVANPSAADRGRAAAPLAAFLRSLHDYPADRARAAGATGDTIRRLDLEYRVEQLGPRLDAAVEQGLLHDRGQVEFVHEALPRAFRPRTDTLTHGDLYARHLLFSDADELCGVIDWGDVHVGDAAVDLAIAYGFLPPNARETFFQEYGDISAETHAVARFRALYHAVNVALYAADVDDADLLREGRLALEHVRASDR